MSGIATGIPGAKAFDELFEQSVTVRARNLNDGKPPDSRIVIEDETVNDFRKSVLQALGFGRNITGVA